MKQKPTPHRHTVNTLPQSETVPQPEHLRGIHAPLFTTTTIFCPRTRAVRPTPLERSNALPTTPQSAKEPRRPTG